MNLALLLLSSSVASHSCTSRSLFGKVRLALMFLIISFSPGQNLFSQTKQTETVQQAWFGYFNQTRFSDKWGLWTDIHLRTKKDFVSDLSQSILRFGLIYYINDDTKLAVGYAYVSHY